MPGVVISTSVRTGPSTATVRDSSQLFVVGLAERGPSDTATLVQSIAEFEDAYGGYQSYSYLHPTVEAFFEEGGTQCYIARTVGDAATVGTLTLETSASVDVIEFTANGPGDWSEDVEIEVTHPSASTFKINIYYQDELKYTTGTVSTISQAVGRINSSAIATRYVSAAVESTSGRPAESGPTALTAGDDDRSNVVAADYVSALELFSDAYGAGAVTCAEECGATVAAGLVTHANTYSRIALLFDTEAASTSSVKAKALAIQAEDHAEHAAIYYPWVEAPTSVAGVTRFIPPVGYVAGKRAVAHNSTGPHSPAAGLNSSARFIINTKTEINKTVGDDLDENYVNALRVIQNTVRIYGARSCSADTDNFRYITQQDVVNSVVTEAYKTLEDLVFSPIDARGAIFAQIEGRLTVILANMRDIGALYPATNPLTGADIDPGFTVKCDKTINPVSTLQTGTIKARIGLRVSAVGDKIEVDIVKSNLTASVV